jgi:hypothetical protein
VMLRVRASRAQPLGRSSYAPVFPSLDVTWHGHRHRHLQQGRRQPCRVGAWSTHGQHNERHHQQQQCAREDDDVGKGRRPRHSIGWELATQIKVVQETCLGFTCVLCLMWWCEQAELEPHYIGANCNCQAPWPASLTVAKAIDQHDEFKLFFVVLYNACSRVTVDVSHGLSGAPADRVESAYDAQTRC